MWQVIWRGGQLPDFSVATSPEGVLVGVIFTPSMRNAK